MTYRPDELLIAAVARMLDGLHHVAVGASSPVPAGAALLARERSGGAMRVSILGRQRDNPFTDGGRELFDCAAQGRIDAFFLGGAQIDGCANINLVGVEGYPNSRVRFPGSFGSSYLYLLVPRVILFTRTHTRRVLVPRVEFVSAAGTSPDNVYRTGGPYALVTERCIFRFDRARSRFVLRSVHPGHDVEEIRAHTGFHFDSPEEAGTTDPPDRATLALIRGPIRDQMRDVYPRYVAEVLDGVFAQAD